MLSAPTKENIVNPDHPHFRFDELADWLTANEDIAGEKQTREDCVSTTTTRLGLMGGTKSAIEIGSGKLQ